MWTLSTSIRPWCDRSHDLKLASEICSVCALKSFIVDNEKNDKDDKKDYFLFILFMYSIFFWGFSYKGIYKSIS